LALAFSQACRSSGALKIKQGNGQGLQCAQGLGLDARACRSGLRLPQRGSAGVAAQPDGEVVRSLEVEQGY